MGTTERVKVGINAQFDTYREVEAVWSIKPGSFRAYTMASARLRAFFFTVEVGDMTLHRPLAEHKFSGNLVVGHALSYEV